MFYTGILRCAVVIGSAAVTCDAWPGDAVVATAAGVSVADAAAAAAVVATTAAWFFGRCGGSSGFESSNFFLFLFVLFSGLVYSLIAYANSFLFCCFAVYGVPTAAGFRLFLLPFAVFIFVSIFYFVGFVLPLASFSLYNFIFLFVCFVCISLSAFVICFFVN